MKLRNWWKLPLLSLSMALVVGAFFSAEQAYGRGSSNNKCKDHDRCREHDKCRQHDKGHQKCKPKVDKCKTHDRCEAHDKCKAHDKGHSKCKSKDLCKDHDRCKPHDKCRKHDRAHNNCPPKNPPNNPPNNPPTNQPPAVTATTYSGQAIAVHLTNLTHGPATVLIGDTEQLRSTGGVRVVNVASTNVQDFLKIDMARASISGRGHQSLSEVSITDFTLLIQALHDGSIHRVTFDSMQVVATAECREDGTVRVNSAVSISGLQVDNVAVNVTGNVDQRIDYNGGHILINHRSSVTASNYGEITVAGLWIHNDGCMEGPIGLVHADIQCSTNAPGGGGGGGGGGGHGDDDCPDRVTGGGFILDSGERANFGVGGGIQNGRLWGHLNYKDHGTGMHVKASEVTRYEVVDADTRMIGYNVTIDGRPGTARVVVTDAGEPGRDDIFVIELSNGYMAGGDLGGSGSGGGNIQLHKGKCSKCEKECAKCQCPGNGNGGGNGGGKGDDDDDDNGGKGGNGGGHDDDDDNGGKGGDDDDDDGGGKGGNGGKDCKIKDCKDCKSGKGH